MKIRETVSLALAAIVLSIAFPGAISAQTPPAATSGSQPAPPTPAQFALALLRRAADRLSAATNLTFKTTSSVEVESPVGQMINYFSTAEVAVHRPDKVAIKKGGDGPSFDLYYDGKTFGALDGKLGLYAQLTAPPTLDALIPMVEERTGMHFPYADVLFSDVYGAVTKDLTVAYWVGNTTIGGIDCDHLAFAGPGIEWQIWIGPEKDPLPRRLAVTYLSVERQPRFQVDFSDWDLNAKLPPSRFEFKPPADAKLIEFRPAPANTNH
jgi:hypothetical protein